jgi:hypothetical protein
MKGTRAINLPLSAPPPMAIAQTVAQKIIWKMLESKDDEVLLSFVPQDALTRRALLECCQLALHRHRGGRQRSSHQ